MRINYDCIRDILICLEDIIVLNDDLISEDIDISTLCKELPDYSKQEIAYAAKMLSQAEYIEAGYSYANGVLAYLVISDITFSGHKYLETVRNSKFWEELKSTLRSKSIELSIDAILLAAKTAIQSNLIS